MSNRIVILVVSALAGLAMMSAAAMPRRMPMTKLERPMAKIQKANHFPFQELKAAKKGGKHD